MRPRFRLIAIDGPTNTWIAHNERNIARLDDADTWKVFIAAKELWKRGPFRSNHRRLRVDRPFATHRFELKTCKRRGHETLRWQTRAAGCMDGAARRQMLSRQDSESHLTASPGRPARHHLFGRPSPIFYGPFSLRFRCSASFLPVPSTSRMRRGHRSVRPLCAAVASCWTEHLVGAACRPIANSVIRTEQNVKLKSVAGRSSVRCRAARARHRACKRPDLSTRAHGRRRCTIRCRTVDCRRAPLIRKWSCSVSTREIGDEIPAHHALAIREYHPLDGARMHFVPGNSRRALWARWTWN